MYKTIQVCTVVFAMSAVPALAQQPDTPTTPRKGTQSTGTKTGAPAGSDQQWVMTVAKDGLAEVELGKLAAQKGGNEQVKQFGQKMANDHGKANDELKSIATTKNITLPAEPDPKHKAVMDRLSKLSGEAFDRAYTQEMVAGHKKAVSAFRTESKSGKDPEVKAFAAKTLPTIEEHLKEIQELNRSVAGTSGVKQTEKSRGENPRPKTNR